MRGIPHFGPPRRGAVIVMLTVLAGAMLTMAYVRHLFGGTFAPMQAAVEAALLTLGVGPVLWFALARPARTRAIEEQLRLFQRAVEQSPVSIVITDLAGGIAYVNPKFCELTGYAAEEVLGQNPRVLKGGETDAGEYRGMWRTLIDGGEWRGEFHNRKKNGEFYWERAHISAIIGDSGRPTHFLAVKTDVTQEKLIAEELKASETKFRVLSEHAHDAVVMMNNAGEVAFWNAAAQKIFGFSPEAAMGKNLHALLSPGQVPDTHGAALARFGATGTGDIVGRTIEVEAQRADGTRIPIELSIGAAPAQGGWSAIAIARDISERKQAQRELGISQERFRLAFEHSAVGKALISAKGAIVKANPALCALLERTADELALFHLLDCIHPDSVSQFREAWARLQAEGGVHLQCECRLLPSSGRLAWGDLSYSLIRDEKGLPISGILQVHDTTARHDGDARLRQAVSELEQANASLLAERVERARVESELMLAHKLEAVGQLAAGIAHEINTPMQFIGDSARFLSQATPSVLAAFEACRGAVRTLADVPGRGEDAAAIEKELDTLDVEFNLGEMPRALDRIAQGVTRVSVLVKAMKEFGHPGQREKAPADINHLLQTTLIVAHNEYKYVANVETDFGTLPLVPCVIGEINQVFLNLLVNAAHAVADKATPEGERGMITIRTRIEADDVVIELADSGGGIPEAIRTRVFEPFFTTKPPGKGTGQGLAIARSIVVDRHAGALTYTSRPGEGTTFTIRLPLTDKHTISEVAA